MKRRAVRTYDFGSFVAEATTADPRQVITAGNRCFLHWLIDCEGRRTEHRFGELTLPHACGAYEADECPGRN